MPRTLRKATGLFRRACETILERFKNGGTPTANRFSVTDELKRFSRRFTSVLVNVAQVWSPEYIPLAHPIMYCALINPWDIAFGSKNSGKIPSFELSELLLAHFTRYWNLGKLLGSCLAGWQGIRLPDERA
jgi:hypothetical protein